MTELSAHVPETQWEDGEFVLSRAVPDGEPLPILTAVPLTAPPSPGAIARLQHAFKLRNELDAAWAARPLRLVTDNGRLALLRGSRRRAPVAAPGAALGDRFVLALCHWPGSCAGETPRARPHPQR